MAERRQIWLFVGACLVVYAVVMFGFSFAIQEPVKWAVGSLIAHLGVNGTLGLFAVAGAVAVAWLVFTGRDYVPAPQPEYPRWFRWSRAVYLSLIGLALLGAFAGILIAE